jgi:hypothetical protein
MPPSDDTIRKIAEAVRLHVDAAALEKIVNELLNARQQELPGGG